MNRRLRYGSSLLTDAYAVRESAFLGYAYAQLTLDRSTVHPTQVERWSHLSAKLCPSSRTTVLHICARYRGEAFMHMSCSCRVADGNLMSCGCLRVVPRFTRCSEHCIGTSNSPLTRVFQFRLRHPHDGFSTFHLAALVWSRTWSPLYVRTCPSQAGAQRHVVLCGLSVRALPPCRGCDSVFLDGTRQANITLSQLCDLTVWTSWSARRPNTREMMWTRC